MPGISMKIYSYSPIWVQNILSSLKGYQLRKLRYGGIFKEELEKLDRSQWWPKEDLIYQQNENLQKTIQYAYKNVQYYKELFDTLKLVPSDFRTIEDLQKLPILTKKIVRIHFNKFISTSVPKNSIIHYSTSGSTGSPLPLACDAATIQKDWAIMWRANRRFGVDYTARGAHFPGKVIVPSTQYNPPFWRSNSFANQKIFSVYHIGPNTVNHYLDELDRWAPDYWYGYSSAMSLISKYALQIGRRCSSPPKAIFAGSEKVYPDDRKAMMKVGQCKVMSGYGSQEYVCRIMECEKGSFHVDTEYGIAEIIGDDGLPAKSGRLVATGFANKVMPLIRYDTGDLSEWYDGQCPCGRKSPRIKEIIGRIEDYITMFDGRTIGRLSSVVLVSKNVIESQIYQPDLHTIVIRIVKDKNYTLKDEAAILKALREKVGSLVDIRCVYVDALPKTSSGKLRAIVSDVH